MPVDKSKKFTVSINRKLIDKNIRPQSGVYLHFEKCILTIDEFIEEIKLGYAYSSVFDGDRRSQNFESADFVSVDIDSDFSFSDAAKHPFVVKNATFLYTTPSHTAEWNRFRIVFALEKPIKIARDYLNLAKNLADLLGGDRKATDPARIFYGNRSAKVLMLNNHLTSADVKEVITRHEAQNVWTPSPTETRQSNLRISTSERVRLRDGMTHSIDAIHSGTSIFCPFHNDTNPSAVVYETKKGTKFIRCFACGQSYWQEKQATYNFDLFDAAVAALEAQTDASLRLGDIRRDLSSIQVVNERFLPDVALKPGVTFIKSAKGTGKTQQIQRVVTEMGAAKRILLIGHRVSLIRAMCARLGLQCYLDKPDGGWQKFPHQFGVSIDSLHQVNPANPYDLVILDECEQILDHFTSRPWERSDMHG